MTRSGTLAEATPQPAAALPEQNRLRLIPSWPFLIGLAVFGRLLVARLSLLNDPDTYLHIAAGRWMLAHHALPSHDTFSHSLPGAPWVSSEWLAQLALAAVYSAAGWSGIVLLAAACEALTIGLLLNFLLRRFDPIPALIAALAGAALLQPHALARPHVFALPLLVLWAGLLVAARDAERPPPYLALPLIVLWANLHASYLFGIALAGFFAAEAVWQPAPGVSRRQEAIRWGVFVVAALVAALLTPYGIAGLLQPIGLLQMTALQSTFTEWLSPDFQKSPALEVWLLGVLFIGFATGARLPLPRLLLLLGLVHLCLQHSRHADLLAIVGPLAVAASLGPQLAALTAGQPPSPLFVWAARLARPATPPAAILGLAIGIALALPVALHPIVRSDDAVTPATALATAQRLEITGPVFNSETFGGFLVFEGVPTLIDGRIEMYGNDFLARQVAAEQGDSAAFDELVRRYRIAWALLIPHSGVAALLERSPDWEPIYSDDVASVFRRIAPK